MKNNVAREAVTPLDIKVFSDAIVELHRENFESSDLTHHFWDWIDQGEKKVIELIQSPPATGDVAEMQIRKRAAEKKRAILQAENVVIDYRFAGENSGSYILMKRPEDPRVSAFEDRYGND